MAKLSARRAARLPPAVPPDLIRPVPTQHPEVNAVLDVLCAGLRQALGEELVGVYLSGSLANGGFDRSSDVDVLVVTRQAVPDRLLPLLQRMHTRLAAGDCWCATQLEVSYIPVAALRRHDPLNNIHPHLDRGPGQELHLMHHDSDWVVQRFVLRERGIVLSGPNPRSLIDPVSANDLRLAMQPVLHGWLAGLVRDPARIESRGYQSYIVLTVCRVLYTLQHGDTLSKAAAAQWAKETLDEHWKPLIERAWLGRQTPDGLPDPDEINETLTFIGYALNYNCG